jgi:hypothetical protein
LHYTFTRKPLHFSWYDEQYENYLRSGCHRLAANNLTAAFHDLTYPKRKDFARQVADAKAEETRARRIQNIIAAIS